MMTTFNSAGHALASGDGQRVCSVGTLMSIKAGREQTHGGFTLLEQLSPRKLAAPAHVHDAEEQGFFVLDGQLSVACGEQTRTVEQGGFVLLPRGIRTRSRGPRCEGVADHLTGRLRAVAAEAGEPAASPVLPPPAEPKLAKLLAALANYGKRMAGTEPHATARSTFGWPGRAGMTDPALHVGFTDVDHTADPRGFVRHLDWMSATEQVKASKRRTFARLELRTRELSPRRRLRGPETTREHS